MCLPILGTRGAHYLSSCMEEPAWHVPSRLLARVKYEEKISEKTLGVFMATVHSWQHVGGQHYPCDVLCWNGDSSFHRSTVYYIFGGVFHLLGLWG
jgi:hypothetical protein